MSAAVPAAALGYATQPHCVHSLVMLQLEGNQVALEGASRTLTGAAHARQWLWEKVGGLTGSDYADVIELHTLHNLVKEKPQERLGIWIQTDEPQGNHLVFTKCKSTSTTQIKCNLMQIKGFATSSTQHLCLSEYVSYLQWALKMYLCHRVYLQCICVSVPKIFAVEANWVWVTQLTPDWTLAAPASTSVATQPEDLGHLETIDFCICVGISFAFVLVFLLYLSPLCKERILDVWIQLVSGFWVALKLLWIHRKRA